MNTLTTTKLPTSLLKQNVINMKTNAIVKTSGWIVAIFCVAVFFYSCRKSNNGTSSSGSVLFENSKVVQGTIFGQVIGENGLPIENAEVKVGTNTFITGKDGSFFFSKINTKKNATLITVNKNNHYTGYKTLKITANTDHFTKITLLEMKSPSTFNAVTGGAVNIAGGAKVTFPANAIVYKSNNTPYTGTVTMYGRWIDPSGSNLLNEIPGDLRAVDAENYERILQTFGMMAVELFDDANQPLQIASSKTAQLSFPIPNSLMSKAPSTIPLWFFDDATGMWKEEGSATKQGNNYIGEVKHFSFWNCDVPNNYVNFDVTLQDNSGNPLANILVKITNTSTGLFAFGYTNSSGFVSGFVPDNATLTMEVMVPICNQVIHTQTVNTLSTAVSLGVVNVAVPPANTAIITGNLVDCSAAAVTNGYVSVLIGTQYMMLQTDPTGNFTANVILCVLPSSATINAYNMTTNEYGTSTINLNVGNNALGTLTACGTLSQFVNWTSTVAGVPTSFSIVEPLGNFGGGVNGGLNQIYAADSNVLGASRYLEARFNGSASTSGTHELTGFSDHLDGNGTPAPGINVNLTSYGAIGSFISGSFTGVITGTAIPTRTVDCSFRITRTN